MLSWVQFVLECMESLALLVLTYMQSWTSLVLKHMSSWTYLVLKYHGYFLVLQYMQSWTTLVLKYMYSLAPLVHTNTCNPDDHLCIHTCNHGDVTIEINVIMSTVSS
jgi:hypothetical protein